MTSSHAHNKRSFTTNAFFTEDWWVSQVTDRAYSNRNCSLLFDDSSHQPEHFLIHLVNYMLPIKLELVRVVEQGGLSAGLQGREVEEIVS